MIAALALLVRVGRRVSGDASPRSRIMAVRERIGRLGHGIGIPPPAWETDREYLTRLSGGTDAGRSLALACTEARYSPVCSDTLAVQAEDAGAELARTLLDGRPGWQRPLIRIRGDAAAGWRRLRRRS
jgi:hypothetical protein